MFLTNHPPLQPPQKSCIPIWYLIYFLFQDFKVPGTSKSKQSARNQSTKYLRKKEEDFLASCTNAINQIIKTPNDDEFGAMAITWASKLRKLKEEQMVLAEGLINQVLQKGYFNELSRSTAITDGIPNNTFSTSNSCPPSSPRSTQLVSPRSSEVISPQSSEVISPRSTDLVSPQPTELLSPRSTENVTPNMPHNYEEGGPQLTTYYTEFSQGLLG